MDGEDLPDLGSDAPVPVVGDPFGEVAATIPGSIEAEEYDLGGEGVAYLDEDEANNGGVGETTRRPAAAVAPHISTGPFT